MSKMTKKVPHICGGGGSLMRTRGLALFLAFVLSFSLMADPLQVFASQYASPAPTESPYSEGNTNTENNPYEVGADTRLFETTAQDGTSFTAEFQSDTIPEDATLVVDLLDEESDEYLDAMLSAWISYDIDPDKDLFEMIPYDIYFVDANGARISTEGEIRVSMQYPDDPFASIATSDAERFVSFMEKSGESVHIDIEMDEDTIQFTLPAFGVFGLVILEKEPLMPGDSGSIEALADLPKDEVGAAYELPQIHMLGMVGGDNWYFDIYYVGEDDYYYAEYDHDFNLKYQIEVHVDQDYDPCQIQIRVPKALFNFRDGNPLVPAPEQIAVPAGRPEAPTPTASSQFNYYEDTDTGELVFFNYCKIVSGTNNAWQVLYKNVKVMEVVDETTWNITAKAEVTDSHGTDKQSATPLSGRVNTSAVLTNVTKTAYSNTGAVYGPGLYTEAQVKRYIDTDLPAWCSGDHFADYKYVLWRISLNASASQPYTITIKDTKSPEGQMVGGSPTVDTSTNWSKENFDKENFKLDSNSNVWLESKTKDLKLAYYVVIAYPATTVKDGDMIRNEVEFTLHPIDGIDEDTTLSAEASWRYEDYHWVYRGNIIGIDKWTPVEYKDHISQAHSQSFPGWLEAYKEFRRRGEVDKGVSLPFELESISRSFELTHTIEEGTAFGHRKPGMVTRVTTVDDAVYAIPNSGTAGTETTMLTSKDYYFEKVEIVQTDRGYDIWEDNYSEPEGLEAADTKYPGLEIYAMFADSSTDGLTSDQWEHVATVDWDSSGVLKYTFTPEQIARHPYRVMAVHDTVNYVTWCDIDVDIHILIDSPVVNGFLDADPDMPSIQFENVGGVTGLLLQDGEPVNLGGAIQAPMGEDSTKGWYHDYRIEHGNYSETGLAEFSNTLYNVLPMRDSALANITPIEKSAKALKTHTASNDIVNGRLNVIYNLTAHDGWKIGSEEIANTLMENNLIQSPGRKSVVFYDLLPYGMQFDPSYEIVAGRVTDIQEKEEKEWVNPKSWNTTDVSVEAKVISTNYKDTNRTMVRFTITYTGADDPVTIAKTYDPETELVECNYFEGWGVSFQGYFTWENIIYSDKSPNVCAFMPAPDDTNPLLGAPGEIFEDDGQHPGVGLEEDYKLLGPDIDDNGVTTGQYVLYANELVMDDSATASMSNITKLVRADSNMFGPFEKSAVVEPGGTYTYEITVKNTEKDIKGIVVFDRLEHANEDRVDADGEHLPNEPDFDDTVWHGTFLSVITDQLKDFDVEPVIYYNADRNAIIPKEDGTETPDNILTTANGWYKASEFKGEVQAIAVDLRHSASGEDFKLGPGESISFCINMKAPADPSGATWTYNNPSFYREMVVPEGDRDKQLVIGNSVQVKYGDKKTLEIKKEFKGDVPDDVKNDIFTLYLTETIGSGDYEETHKFSDRVYKLYTWKDNEWVQESENKILTTGADGIVTLKAGQKAVFEDIASASVISVTEEESPFWDATITKNTDNDPYTFVIQNEFRPVLYVQKNIDKIPDTERGKAALENDEFTFQVTVNGNPAADVPFWYVQNVRTDGGIPQRVPDTVPGKTDENGKFTLKYGEIVAIIGAGLSGDPYTVQEVDVSNDWENWICESDTVSGNLQLRGSSTVITNIYKWRSFFLTKSIQYQDLADAEDVTFTFKVEKKIGDNYEVVTGNKWTLLDEDMQDTATAGELSADGTFTCALAGKTVRIDDLEADATYRITEVSPAMMGGEDVFNSLYEPVKNSDEWKMPLHALTASGEFTNNWRMRPLYITKTVTYDSLNASAAQKANNTEFEMQVKVAVDNTGDGIADGDPVPLADFDYDIYYNGQYYDSDTTDSDGKFTIKNGWTVYFEDAGLIGAAYEITEIPTDPDFEQTYPADKKPSTGKLGINGTEDSPAAFVNGATTSIMITKEYAMDPYADWYYSEFSYLDHGENPLEVAITVRAFTATESYIWPNAETEVVVFDEYGDSTNETWYPHKPFNLLPGCTVILPNGMEDSNVTAFTVTESAADRQWVVAWEPDEYDQYIIECTQTYPEKPTTYQNGVDRSIKLVNTLTAHSLYGSAIMKDMAPGSNEVPNYARLVFMLEKKVGEEWVPAEGVQYYVGYYNHGDTEIDWKNIDGNQTYTTGADGLIQISKSENGYPFLQFFENDVYVYGDPLMPTSSYYDDILRIREVLEMSDSSWGKFAWNSLLSQGDKFEAQWQKTEGERDETYDTIVNTNRTTKVRIGKQSSSESSQTFTFTLKQIVGVDWSKALGGITSNNYKDAITSTTPAAGIVYYVCERDDEGNVQQISGPHEIGEDGAFTLQAGQYAEFDLPDKTMWTVQEESTPGFYLEDLTVIEGPSNYTTKLDENLMMISSIAEALGYRLTATAKQYAWDPGVEIDKEQLDVRFYSSDGTYKTLTSEEFTIDIEKVPTKTGKFTVTVTDKSTGLTATVLLYSGEPYTVKYAVRIYGINVDDYYGAAPGEKASLTFGPATGTNPEANYTDNTNGRNLCQHQGKNGICISDLSWDEIITQANEDPTVFEKCMEAGCVVSVPLNITGPLAGTSYEGKMDDGDGASVLYNSIASNYRSWNSEYDETGGWPASRIRATLNGQDTETNTTVAGTDCLTTDQSLFSAFPQVLQDAIVAKTVKSDTVYNSFDVANVKTTYDKLWLFSADEIFAYDPGGSYYNNYLRYENGKTNEGPQYPANQYMGITAANYSNNIGFTESGSSDWWWLRSLYRSYSRCACCVDYGGIPVNYSVYSPLDGLAPGFCIR